jgi:hypothetical protein
MRRLAFVVVLLAPACSSAPNKRSVLSESQCKGDRTVIVKNRSGRDADVVAERKSGGAPYELGTVRPGREEEITLPADAGNAYTRTPRDPSSGSPPNGAGNIDLRYGCRQ